MPDETQYAALNDRFGIAGISQVVMGNEGLPKISITTAAGSAEIYLHGAQITSWRPAGFGEVLFLSSKSRWEEGRAIRGGIPICFPWFRAKADDPKAPAHGFVRTKDWKLEAIKAQVDGSVTVVCATESDESTRRWWPHEFRIVHRITIGGTLTMDLTVTNRGTTIFEFEEALHTYFSVDNVENVRVRGLDGVAFLDNTDANGEKMHSGDLTLTAATDNAYINARGSAEVVDPDLRRVVRTEKENSATTIVWNPWQQGAAQLADLGDDEWRAMICVEASNILAAAVSLSPGEEHTMRATLSVAPDRS